MIIAGLGFKASAAPFHMWTPDVYQGAPTAVTGFMSAATKSGRARRHAPHPRHRVPRAGRDLDDRDRGDRVASLAVGNLAALVQRDVKRLLAYSSISQAGFLLIAVAAEHAREAASALLYFLVPYGAASLGAFAVVALRERELGRDVTLDDLAGFGWERPLYGVAMWAFVLSFAGLPFTGGFLGKFYVFAAAYEAGWWWLVVIGVRRDGGQPLLLPRDREGDVHAHRPGARARGRRRRRLAAARRRRSGSAWPARSRSPWARSSSCSRSSTSPTEAAESLPW